MGAAREEVRIDLVDKAYKDKLDALVRRADSIFAGLLDECTVEAEDGATELWGHIVSDMQADITVSDTAIYGTLFYVSEGQLVTDWGAGYFLTLKFDDFAEGLTYANVQVGLDPSVSSGLVTLDGDQNGVFKVSDKDNQVLKVVSSSDSQTCIQEFDLTNLVLKEV